jgi:hypothetical protein
MFGGLRSLGLLLIKMTNLKLKCPICKARITIVSSTELVYCHGPEDKEHEVEVLHISKKRK